MKFHFRKILSFISLSLALCICAGLTAFLSIEPSVVNAAVDDFQVDEPQLDREDAALYSSKPLPKLSINVDLGSFAVNYATGNTLSKVINRTLTTYGQTIEFYTYTKKNYYVEIGLTDRVMSESSINQSNYVNFERENGYLNFLQGTNNHGCSMFFKTPDDVVQGEVTEYTGPILESEFIPGEGFCQISDRVNSLNGRVSFGFDLYQYYDWINENKKPDWDWESYIAKDLNFYVILVEEQLIGKELSKNADGSSNYEYSANYIIHNSHLEQINIRQMVREECDSGIGINSTDLLFSNMLNWAGYEAISPEEKVPIDVIYREMTGVTTYAERTQSFQLFASHAVSWNLVNGALQSNLGVKSYTDFNACYRDIEVLENGIVNLNSERIIYQATGYSYKYDFENHRGIVTVQYTDFFAKDFAIELRSNDPLDDSAIYIYSTDVTTNESNTTITFDFRKIEEQLLNQKGWIVQLDESDFEIRYDTRIEVINESGYLTLIVPKDNQNLLSEVEVLYTAEIIEDVDVIVTYEYQSLYLDESQDICKEVITSAPITIKYSEVISMSNNNFYVIYQDTIENALNLNILNDCVYMTYDGVERITIEEGKKYKFVVNYNYRMIVKVIHPDGHVAYVQADAVNGNKNLLESLNVEIPEGERLDKILTMPADSFMLSVNKENFEDSVIYVTCNMHEDIIGNIEIITSDQYFVRVNYLEQFKETPFAYPKNTFGTAKVTDIQENGNYDEFLKKFLNVDSLKCLRSNVESIDVIYNGKDTYEFNLKYTFCSLRKIDYNGNVTGEVKVPLTRYKDWAESMGKEWSILFLNMPNTTYFEYSSITLPDGNTINEDNLYGYFAVAIFEEKVSDLNYYFKGYSGDGVVSMFEATQATGGNIYKRLASIVNRSEYAIFNIPFYPALAFCELMNTDNKMYHSYFFYLDCKVDPNKTYISNGRADGADDTDGAFGNVVEDTADKVGTVFEDIFKKDDGNLKWYTWLLIGFASLLTLAIFIRIIRKK